MNDSEADDVLRLCGQIDALWDAHTQLRAEIKDKTTDPLSVWGQDTDIEHQRSTIRDKDRIYDSLYLSKGGSNASPYARLKAVMDYWCALWFWPIDKADELPNRMEFLWDINMLLGVGVVDTSARKGRAEGQLSFFDDLDLDPYARELSDRYGKYGAVNLDQLRADFPRLRIANEVAEQQKFFHWELEFSDVFEEQGGFDLVIGNPPWIKITWNEQNILSERTPILAVRSLDATETIPYRNLSLQRADVRASYMSEYVTMTGQQLFLNAVQNYPLLKGQQANLFRCFLPQAWQFGNSLGISAFVHPDGVYDDPKGKILRKVLYPKIRFHFQFENEFNLFEGTNDHGRMRFSLNVYKNGRNSVDFISINNLFIPSTIEECLEGEKRGEVPGIKTKDDQWNICGHPGRVLRIRIKELRLFSRLFDDDDDPTCARLPNIHARAFLETLEIIANAEDTLGKHSQEFFSTLMWDETNAHKAGIITRNIHFPAERYDAIFSGAHVGVLNPFYKGMRKVYKSNNDYDSIYLDVLDNRYLQRCMYSIGLAFDEYMRNVPKSDKGIAYTSFYRLCVRKMLNQNGERTLIGAILPKEVGHINGLIGFAFEKTSLLVLMAALFGSLPYDFFIKVMGRSNLYGETANMLPIVSEKYWNRLILRSMLLNCLTEYYSDLWNDCYNPLFSTDGWTKQDSRLHQESFAKIKPEWTWGSPLRTD